MKQLNTPFIIGMVLSLTSLLAGCQMHYSNQWEKSYEEGLNAFKQGQFEIAQEHFEQAKDVTQKFDTQDPRRIRTLFKLAETYRVEGKYSDAETAVQHALSSSQSQVTQGLDELAHIYEEQNKYEDAEGVYHLALMVREKSLPEEHAELAMSMYNLANLYLQIIEKNTEQGTARYSQVEQQNLATNAKNLLQKALAIQEKTLETNDPKLGWTLLKLAKASRLMGVESDQVKKLERRGEAILSEKK